MTEKMESYGSTGQTQGQQPPSYTTTPGAGQYQQQQQQQQQVHHMQYPYQQQPAPGNLQYSNQHTESQQYLVPALGEHITYNVNDDDDDDDDEDVYHLGNHVKVSFNKVFVEPKACTSFGPVREVNNVLFKYVQLGIYRTLSTLLGFILSVTCGLIFGITNFGVVWLIQPGLKLWFIGLRLANVVINAIIKTMCDPFYLSIAQTLSRIKGNFTLNVNPTGLRAITAEQTAAGETNA